MSHKSSVFLVSQTFHFDWNMRNRNAFTNILSQIDIRVIKPNDALALRDCISNRKRSISSEFGHIVSIYYWIIYVWQYLY